MKRTDPGDKPFYLAVFAGAAGASFLLSDNPAGDDKMLISMHFDKLGQRYLGIEQAGVGLLYFRFNLFFQAVFCFSQAISQRAGLAPIEPGRMHNQETVAVFAVSAVKFPAVVGGSILAAEKKAELSKTTFRPGLVFEFFFQSKIARQPGNEKFNLLI